MSKNILIVLLGLFVALVPFLGFPGSWKTFLLVVSGLLIAFLSFAKMAHRRRTLYEKMNQIPHNDPHRDRDIHIHERSE
ncbi:MAG: hypothetical protein WD003_01670 [Candidatus Paceibacterota bacterium]